MPRGPERAQSRSALPNRQRGQRILVGSAEATDESASHQARHAFTKAGLRPEPESANPVLTAQDDGIA